ncbi:MAG: carbon storage regulator [Sulfurimonas sp.]|jgi:carbon storage regulator|uniref:carbon storage regulator CsrA n=1 Tax=Sulfurimonas sp. TaxID=2022749 RepID=UPI0039E4824F
MLVLARKEGESIVIGDNIIIKVISIEKGVIKFGIDAPKSIPIMRSELLEDVKESNIAASKEVDSSILSKLSQLISK